MQLAIKALSMLTHVALPERAPAPVAHVERIFLRLSAQLGSKVADLFGGVPPEVVKAEWADALAGFHVEEIARGLASCQTRVFAPTLGEFLRLCRPALDPEIAWLEARDGMADREAGRIGDWTHPAVYRAASELQWELRTGSFKDHRKTWTHVLERELRRGWGDEVQTPMPRLAYARERKPAPARTFQPT